MVDDELHTARSGSDRGPKHVVYPQQVLTAENDGFYSEQEPTLAGLFKNIIISIPQTQNPNKKTDRSHLSGKSLAKNMMGHSENVCLVYKKKLFKTRRSFKHH